MLHDGPHLLQQVAIAFLLGFQGQAVQRLHAGLGVMFGQAEASATFPGAQDHRVNQPGRQFATIKKYLSGFLQAWAVYAGHDLYLSHHSLQYVFIFIIFVLFNNLAHCLIYQQCATQIVSFLSKGRARLFLRHVAE
jgi:hypothetical protein